MINKSTVFLERCVSYTPELLLEYIDKVMTSSGLVNKVRGGRVLLKPNLISGSGDGLACTHPIFIGCIASWCIDNGALVSLGDSPAFGSSERVLKKIGAYDDLVKMGVRLVDFNEKKELTLNCGVKVGVAKALQECELFLNIPKVKAHSQMFVTIAMKNLFGIVSGVRKPLLHMQYGDSHSQFSRIIVDLLELLPENFSFVDGVEAMHKTGPIAGERFPLHCLAAGENPVALDTAIMRVLGLRPEKNPLLVEARNRELLGVSVEHLSFPFRTPGDFSVSGYEVPEQIAPIRFSIARFIKGQVKRLAMKVGG